MNFTKTKIIAFSIVIFFLAGPNHAELPRIDLTAGTVFLTGAGDVTYEMTAFDKPEHRFQLNTDMGGGYFIIDYLSIGLSIKTNWDIGVKNAGRVGLKLFSTYFFNTNTTIFPYLGGSLTPAFGIRENEFQLLAGIDTGILVSLSESVALDFGLRPEVFFKLYDTQKWKITVPAGYFGVRAVF